MPKYYCDYCDTFLTHDSPSVRKTHCNGRKHKENVRLYYQKWLEEQVQKLVDDTTAAFKTGKGPSTAQFPTGPGNQAMIPSSHLQSNQGKGLVGPPPPGPPMGHMGPRPMQPPLMGGGPPLMGMRPMGGPINGPMGGPINGPMGGSLMGMPPRF